MVEGYQKIRTIGKGSFGTASLYTRLQDQKLVVLKHVTTADMDYEERTSAYNEINILSALHHPNIIRYLDSIVNIDYVIIVMDYADGGNLAQLLAVKKSKNEPFKEKGILFIVSQISSALSYIHGKKILHRDLKPANIFLTSNGSVRVGDFGISKMLNTKSQAQTLVGTPYYLSPEMCAGHEYDEKSDIWALGCIIYQMATLKKPFNAPNLPFLVQKIIKCEYDAIPNRYCKDLKILVELMLQKKADFRPNAIIIHEEIIPDILAKNCTSFDYHQALQGVHKTKSYTKERSILYEITKTNDESNVQPIILPHKKILDFSVSSTHSIVVFDDHTVYAWGSNKYCELGTKNTDTHVENPVYVKSLEYLNIVRCMAGQNFSLFLTKTGHIYNCGRGKTGCLGHGNLANVYFPILLKQLSKLTIIDFACGNEHVVALDGDGKAYVWGSSTNGQLGLDNTGKILSTPKCLPLFEEIKKTYCSNTSTILLSTQNCLSVCGNNAFEKLGVKNKCAEVIVHSFRRLERNFGEVVDVSMSDSHTVIVNSDGHVFLLGDNSYGQLGKHNVFLKSNSNILKLDNKILKSTCNNTYTAMFDEKNVLWVCGTFSSTDRQKDYGLGHNNPLRNMTLVSLGQDEAKINGVKSGNHDDNRKDRIQGLKSILALYSSTENLKDGIFLRMNIIKATTNNLFVVVDTTCPSPFKRFCESFKSSTYSINTYLVNIPGDNEITVQFAILLRLENISYARTCTCCETENKQ